MGKLFSDEPETGTTGEQNLSIIENQIRNHPIMKQMGYNEVDAINNMFQLKELIRKAQSFREEEPVFNPEY